MKDEHDHSAIDLWTRNKLLFFVACFNVWLHSAAHVFARCHKSRQLHIWVIFFLPSRVSFLTQPPRHLCRLCRPQQLNRIRRLLRTPTSWSKTVNSGKMVTVNPQRWYHGSSCFWSRPEVAFWDAAISVYSPLSFAQYSGYFSSMYCLSDIRGSSGP